MKEEELMQYIQEVIEELLAQVAGAKLQKPGSEKALYGRIDNILTQFNLTINQIIPQQVILDYFGGVDEATRLLRENNPSFPATLSLTPAGLIAAPMQQPIHLNALEVLIDDSMSDLNAAVRTAKASGIQNIDRTLQKVRGDLAKGVISGAAQKQTTAKVMTSFREGGLTAFITSDGKKLPLSFYAMTVNRTKTRTAAVQGSVNRYLEAGKDLVKVRTNGDSCKVCSPYKDLVISLTGKTEGYIKLGGAVKLPPFHPNCRCGISLFDPEFVSEAEIELAKLAGREFNPAKDKRTKKQKEAYAREQAGRRKANAEVQQFQRWQETLGAEAPASLPAFRRMKRQNTVKFQELQSEFRSRRMSESWEAKKAAGLIGETAPIAGVAIPLPPVVPIPLFNPEEYQLPSAPRIAAHGDDVYDNQMSVDDVRASNAYVGTGNSWDMNRFLYSGDYDRIKGTPAETGPDNARVIKQIDDFSAVIQKFELPEKMRTIRMVDEDFIEHVIQSIGAERIKLDMISAKAEEQIEQAAALLTGVRFQNKSFTSVSYHPNRNVFQMRPVQMEILSDKGQKGLVTNNYEESEIVFDKDTEFEFISVEAGKDDFGSNQMKVVVRVVK